MARVTIKPSKKSQGTLLGKSGVAASPTPNMIAARKAPKPMNPQAPMPTPKPANKFPGIQIMHRAVRGLMSRGTGKGVKTIHKEEGYGY